MKKLTFILLFTAIKFAAQPITWVQLTGASAPNPPTFIQWEKLTQNPVNHTTVIWGNDGTGGLFGNSFWNFTITNPASATGVTKQVLGTNGSHNQNCSFSREDFPGDRQFNGGFWWDSKRNAFIEAFGVCNLGHPDDGDRMDMWKFTPHYPLQTLTESWQRMNPLGLASLTPQIWGSGVDDPQDDLYFFYGWGTSSEPPKLYCPTDMNPTPGALTTAQTTAGCTSADTWIQPAVGTYTCKTSPADPGQACNNLNLDAHQIPQAQALEYLAWDATTSKIIIMSQGSPLAFFNSIRTWTYDPPTKTFTEITSLSTPPPFYINDGDDIPLISYNSNDNKYYFIQKESFQVNIDSAGSGYTAGNVTFNGSCSVKPRATYTVDGNGSILSTAISLTNVPSVDCVGAVTPSVSGGTGASLSITWLAPHLWTLTPSTWAWTDLGAMTGSYPYWVQSMAVDPAWNAILVFGKTAPGTSEMWVGQLPAAVKPTIMTLSLPAATNGVAYSQQLTAAGSGSMTWTCCVVGSLPSWATLTSGGLLNGTPTGVGTFNFTVTAANGTAPNATQAYTLVVTPATLSIPLTIQESLYPGDKTGHTATPGSGGIARTNASFCMGVPIPDSAQIDAGQWNTLGLSGSDAGLTTLALNGTAAAQFRVLGVWPDGYAKWVEACGIIASFSAGSSATVTLTNTGSGNTGGSNLASDNSMTNTITVNTGTGSCGTADANCFTFKKTNNNGIDSVRIGISTIITAGSGQLGWTVVGPDATQAYPANVTCGTGAGQSPCTQVYAGAYDGYSFCRIEKNGPVQSVIVCFNSHEKTGTYNSYMRTKVRYYFNRGSAAVRAEVSLMNQDVVESSTGGTNDYALYGTTARFGTAYKGFSAYELRLVPTLTADGSGNVTFTIANHTATPTTGTLGWTAGTDSAYIYQGQSTSMIDGDANHRIPINYTADTGYSVVKNGSALTTGTNAQYPVGWADLSDSTGKGVEIGIYQFAAYWPKSLEFNSGGKDIRIGVWPSENGAPTGGPGGGTTPYYQAWPAQSTHDVYLIFHATAPASLQNEFLKMQHPLVGRAGITAYNTACETNPLAFPARCVFPYQLVDSNTEDTFYNSTVLSGITQPTGGSSTVSAISNSNPAVLTLTNASFAATLAKYQQIILSGFSCAGLSGSGSAPVIVGVSGTNITITDDTTSCGAYTPGSGSVGTLSAVTSARTCCLTDYGTTDGSLAADRNWYWPEPGGSNQDEFRFSALMNFITRGMTGRYVYAGHWYRFVGDIAFPRSLGFTWVGRPNYGATGAELDQYGFPAPVRTNSANNTRSFLDWVNSASAEEHLHLYGISDYYFMTGDEAIRDAFQDGMKDYFNNKNAYQGGLSGGLWNARAVGADLSAAARLADALQAARDPDYTTTLSVSNTLYQTQVKAVVCQSGYPAGCNPGTLNGGPWLTQGVSRTRGWAVIGSSGTGSPWCGISQNLRTVKPFMEGILVGGLMEYRRIQGPNWPDYWNALDNAYGISRATLSEGYPGDSTTRWDNNGFHYQLAPDADNYCTGTGESLTPYDFYNLIYGAQHVGPQFMTKWIVEGGDASSWLQQFKVYILRNASSNGLSTSEFGSIIPQHVIGLINNPSTSTLQTVPFTFHDNGDQTYTLTWTGQASAQYYRIKWAAKPIVDWIGFDPGTNQFSATAPGCNGNCSGDPANTVPWFAATNAPGIPKPGGVGDGSITINAGASGLTSADFSVKAMATTLTSSSINRIMTGGRTIRGGVH